VKFNKHLFVESNGGSSRNWTSTLSNSYTAAVPAHSRNSMALGLMVPNIVNPTAIGTIVANYFTIDVQSDIDGCICCCGDNFPLV